MTRSAVPPSSREQMVHAMCAAVDAGDAAAFAAWFTEDATYRFGNADTLVGPGAIAEATRATGTESPADAGASYARPVAQAAPTLASETVVAADAPAATAPQADGSWRVQLGAFSVAGNAERLWSRLGDRAELSGMQRLLVPAGGVTKLQASGFGSRSAADAACRSLRESGVDCLVTDR